MFELYRGHSARVSNQQAEIERLYKELENLCLSTKSTTKGVLVVDWKMKFQSLSAKETTFEHFGKRGLSWHGCLLTYFRYKEEIVNNAVVPSAERVNVYLDQILEGDNQQNAGAVAGMVEAALEFFHSELPDLESVILQSDNAACYQNNELLFLLQLINSRSSVSIERYIHTETQDGKGLIDAHFARAMAVS